MKLELTGISLPLTSFRLEADAVLTCPLTGLTGPSGSGKTTLLEIIAGLRTPRAGRIVSGESVLTDIKNGILLPPPRRRIGYVPQDQALFPHLDAVENLLYPCRAAGKPPDAALLARITDFLEIGPLLNRRAWLLSGGERGRVALGRALMSRPHLLLLDEPLAHLDDRLRGRALVYLRATAEEFRVPMIFVSHSAAELRTLCREIWRMEEGRLMPGSAGGGEAAPP